MKTALFGFAQSGKTSLFIGLVGPQAQKVERAMVKVPEPRLDPLIALFTPKKVTYSEIEILDIPGGGAAGKGVGERVLNEIRPHDCLVALLDAFSGAVDPKSQMASLEADLLVSDLAVAEKRLERIGMDKKKNKALVDPKEEEALVKALALLEAETPLREDSALAEAPELRGFRFLSAKPILYVWNAPEEKLDAFPPADVVDKTKCRHLALAARLEKDLAEIDDPEERAAFMADLGVTGSVVDRVAAKTYELLGLQSFFTAGDKEVRSWPVKRGATAPEAAGVIHTDFQKGFIRAEVLGYEDFLKTGTFKKAKELGLMRLEGKEYIVKDGDIIEFRFNV